MLFLSKPNSASLATFLADQQKQPLSYTAVGATAREPPRGYVVNHTRVALGRGEAVFQAARASLARWEQFQLNWVALIPADDGSPAATACQGTSAGKWGWATGDPAPPAASIQPDQLVAILARGAGMWWLNACRIIYVVDQQQPVARYGYAYGTLAQHVGRGEERFLVECDPVDGRVWYDLYSFSRMNHWLARLATPLVRRAQHRFGQESAMALQQAITRDAVRNEA